jgi:hypothetical protein
MINKIEFALSAVDILVMICAYEMRVFDLTYPEFDGHKNPGWATLHWLTYGDYPSYRLKHLLDVGVFECKHYSNPPDHRTDFYRLTQDGINLLIKLDRLPKNIKFKED